MNASIMNMPLQISSLIEHAARAHGNIEVVSALSNGQVHRYTYADAHQRSRQLASALTRLGVQLGERVATLAWSGYRHFEAYYAVAGMGAVCHTVNPRLFIEQVRYTMQHAQDAVVMVDPEFLPLVESIKPDCPSIRHIIVMADREDMPTGEGRHELLCYEELLAREDGDFAWPQLEENAAAYLSYTSGTTGNPKGVLYSHRSTLLHTFSMALPDAMNLSGASVIAPVIQFFHVNAFGLPCAAPLTGAKLVFPGAALDPASLFALFERERVTMTAAVPTLWQQFLFYLQAQKLRPSSLRNIVIGGSACSPALMKSYQEDYGIHIRHVWGMTETSPLCVTNCFREKHAIWTPEERYALQAKQGRPLFGVEMKVVDSEGVEVPANGTTFGDLLVRGPWIAREYYNNPSPAITSDGWFMTGDVVTLDGDGYMQITDRSKDVIKTGGEWISSIQLENIALAYEAVAEAAVIAVPHPKWDERPLLLVVPRQGATIDRDLMLAHFKGKVANWWIPDDVVTVEALPYTATGKVEKKRLREQFKDHQPSV